MRKPNAYADSDTHGYTDSDTHGHANANAYADKAVSDTTAAPDAVATPDAIRHWVTRSRQLKK